MSFLYEKGIETLFLVSGGGIMHLLDAVKTHGEMTYVCNHHEQAAAISAESYARVRNNIGACLVTTGPGSTNALSAIAGAWVDSIPVIVISGQVRTQLIADYSKNRQIGPQEINIIEMARPVTKYAVTLLDASSVVYELEKAYTLAVSGRPGPVWINVPLDIQSSEIHIDNTTPHYSHQNDNSTKGKNIDSDIDKAMSAINASKRPIIICGNGIHLDKAENELREFSKLYDLPAIVTFGGMDLFDETDPKYMGRFGPCGQRRANFAVQNADLLICLGASMSIASIGFNDKSFAPNAKRLMVNIDSEEFNKINFKADISIISSPKPFIEEMIKSKGKLIGTDRNDWNEACKVWKNTYRTITEDYFLDKDHVNPYVFADVLSDYLTHDDTVITGIGLDAVAIFHSFRLKQGQRVFTNINYGAMGWDLPALVGACAGREGERVILVTGDGSVQFNIQELMTLSFNRLNAKIFIINNGGYESIRATQENYFNKNYIGSDRASGVDNPNFEFLSKAYNINYISIKTNDDLKTKIPEALDSTGVSLIELNVSYHQKRSPRVTSYKNNNGTLSSHTLENMFPFLPADEVKTNMEMFLPVKK